MMVAEDRMIEDRMIRESQTTAPVDITALAGRLGLSVYESNDLPEGKSGRICRDTKDESPSGYTIEIAASDSVPRQRFTIAHELAHYLLHRDKIGDGITDDAMYRSEKLTSADEYAANNKAADLLMPRHLVMDYVGRGINDYTHLAEIFAVSTAAMRVRLRYLLYLK